MLNIYATATESLFKKNTPNTHVTPSKHVTMAAPFAQYLEIEIFIRALKPSEKFKVTYMRERVSVPSTHVSITL
jgi:hypothetical protein